MLGKPLQIVSVGLNVESEVYQSHSESRLQDFQQLYLLLTRHVAHTCLWSDRPGNINVEMHLTTGAVN